MNQQSIPPIDTKQLQEALQQEFDACIKEVTEAVNTARPGVIINDSEEPVRIATAKLRQKIFQKALQMKTDAAEKAAFSPSAQKRRREKKASQ